MKGLCLKIYTHQFQKHEGILVHEWLLEKAKKLGFKGGAAFLSLASFGHEGHLNESHFFELGGGNLTVETSFLLNEEQADQLLALIKKEQLNLFYAKYPVESGYTQNE